MIEYIPDEEPSSPFIRDVEGSLYVDPVRLCQVIGIHPDKLTLRLLVWRSVAQYLEITHPDDPKVTYLPALMIPEFLESLMVETDQSSHLVQMTFFQQMFHQLNDLTSQGANKNSSLWGTEEMTSLHRFVLSQVADDCRARLETECPLD